MSRKCTALLEPMFEELALVEDMLAEESTFLAGLNI